MYGYPPQYPQQPAPVYRPQKSYLTEAIIALVLYYLGFGIIGLIANIMFLNNANRDERQGVDVENKGCLQVLLWVHVIGMILGCIGMIIFLALGGLATIAAFFSEAGF